MATEKADAPQVILFPPAIAMATLVLSIVLQWFWPLGLLHRIEPLPLRIAGALLFAVGLALLLGGLRIMKKAGTNIAPSQPATALVASGVFKLTRNPIYVGGSLIMLALALGFAIDWLVILLIPNQLLLHFGVIVPEEKYLTSKFGEQYRKYTAATPRYLLFF